MALRIKHVSAGADVLHELTAIDLFAGAGGMSLGFRRAGFNVRQAIELDKHAASTYRRNHPATDVVEADIRELDPSDCMRRVGIAPGQLTVLTAGLPCQGFSESNRRTRDLSNPRNLLYKEFFRFLGAIRPKWFVVENVAGLQTLSGGEILQEIVEQSLQSGYVAKWKLLHAEDFGVPQIRRRIFIVGCCLGAEIMFPERRAYVATTVRDAIDDLPRLANGANQDVLPYPERKRILSRYQELMRLGMQTHNAVQGNLVTRNAKHILARYSYIKPGHNWMAIPAGLMKNYRDRSRCHTGIYFRLKFNRPSKVIGNFRKNMLIHPTQDRGLSIREAARLQSFPDDYVFLGSVGFQQQQVADAVPPLLAESVALCVKQANLNVARGASIVRSELPKTKTRRGVKCR